MNVLILGVNGFIGHSLVRTILERTDWGVVGIDVATDKLAGSLSHSRFLFHKGDICGNRGWVDEQIARCDVVLPLVAIATPMAYVKAPLRVFELTFEENLRIVRQCAERGTRLVFPSSSEVYGMCDDEEFTEDRSQLVLGPIERQRWIYASSKQLLDRVIWAYGRETGLPFTLIRPFNWIGPRLDDPRTAKEGSSRVVAQFIADLLGGTPIRLVDGGQQRRCFTYIDDGIECLLRVIENPRGCCDGQIINIGNPRNECSMRQLAEMLRHLYAVRTGRLDECVSEIVSVDACTFYGPGYQDMERRRPSVAKARKLLGWEPRVDLDEALQRTLDACVAAREREQPRRVAAGG